MGRLTATSTHNGDALRMSDTVGGRTTGYTWDMMATGLSVVLQNGANA